MNHSQGQKNGQAILNIELAEHTRGSFRVRSFFIPHTSEERLRNPTGVLTREAQTMGSWARNLRLPSCIDRLPPFPPLAIIPVSKADCHTGC
jgi:hypothetical protein